MQNTLYATRLSSNKISNLFLNNNNLSSAFKVKVNKKSNGGWELWFVYLLHIIINNNFWPPPPPLSNFFRKKIISDQTRRRAYQNSFFPITHSTLYGLKPRMVEWIFPKFTSLFKLSSLPIKSSKFFPLKKQIFNLSFILSKLFIISSRIINNLLL